MKMIDKKNDNEKYEKKKKKKIKKLMIRLPVN